MDFLVGLVGALVGAISVWAVNFYRARVDDEAAINRLMLVRRMACAEELCSLSFKATREMMKPKADLPPREAWQLSFAEAEARAREILEEMWEIVDTFGVYFQEEEFKGLVNIPDYFALLLQAERRLAEVSEGGVDGWDWRESFLEGQGAVRDDIRTICLSSIQGTSLVRSKWIARRRTTDSQLELPNRIERVRLQLQTHTLQSNHPVR